MTMNSTPSEKDKESQTAVDEWLAKGNKIKQLPYGARTENLEYPSSFYGRKKKKSSSLDSQ